MAGLGVEHLSALKDRLKGAQEQLSNAIIDLKNHNGADSIPLLEVDLYLASMQVIHINDKIEAIQLKIRKG